MSALLLFLFATGGSFDVPNFIRIVGLSFQIFTFLLTPLGLLFPERPELSLSILKFLFFFDQTGLMKFNAFLNSLTTT
jgi:hypothetical protein